MSIAAEQARMQSDHFKALREQEFEKNNAHLFEVIDDNINEAIKMGEYEAHYGMDDLTEFEVQCIAKHYSRLRYNVCLLGKPKTEKASGIGYLSIIWAPRLDANVPINAPI